MNNRSINSKEQKIYDALYNTRAEKKVPVSIIGENDLAQKVKAYSFLRKKFFILTYTRTKIFATYLTSFISFIFSLFLTIFLFLSLIDGVFVGGSEFKNNISKNIVEFIIFTAVSALLSIIFLFGLLKDFILMRKVSSHLRGYSIIIAPQYKNLQKMALFRASIGLIFVLLLCVYFSVFVSIDPTMYNFLTFSIPFSTSSNLESLFSLVIYTTILVSIISIVNVILYFKKIPTTKRHLIALRKFVNKVIQITTDPSEWHLEIIPAKKILDDPIIWRKTNVVLKNFNYIHELSMETNGKNNIEFKFFKYTYGKEIGDYIPFEEFVQKSPKDILGIDRLNSQANSDNIRTHINDISKPISLNELKQEYKNQKIKSIINNNDFLHENITSVGSVNALLQSLTSEISLLKNEISEVKRVDRIEDKKISETQSMIEKIKNTSSVDLNKKQLKDLSKEELKTQILNLQNKVKKLEDNTSDNNEPAIEILDDK